MLMSVNSRKINLNSTCSRLKTHLWWACADQLEEPALPSKHLCWTTFNHPEEILQCSSAIWPACKVSQTAVNSQWLTSQMPSACSVRRRQWVAFCSSYDVFTNVRFSRLMFETERSSNTTTSLNKSKINNSSNSKVKSWWIPLQCQTF